MIANTQTSDTASDDVSFSSKDFQLLLSQLRETIAAASERAEKTGIERKINLADVLQNKVDQARIKAQILKIKRDSVKTLEILLSNFKGIESTNETFLEFLQQRSRKEKTEEIIQEQKVQEPTAETDEKSLNVSSTFSKIKNFAKDNKFLLASGVGILAGRILMEFLSNDNSQYLNEIVKNFTGIDNIVDRFKGLVDMVGGLVIFAIASKLPGAAGVIGKILGFGVMGYGGMKLLLPEESKAEGSIKTGPSGPPAATEHTTTETPPSISENNRGVGTARPSIKNEVEKPSISSLPNIQIQPGTTASNIREQLKPLFSKYGSMYGVSGSMLEKMAYAESKFREDIITGKTKSPKGAEGLMQFMPETSKELNVDPLNPESAIEGAARYMNELIKRYKGNVTLAVMAYNWGMRHVNEWLHSEEIQVPNATLDYLRLVLPSESAQEAKTRWQIQNQQLSSSSGKKLAAASIKNSQYEEQVNSTTIYHDGRKFIQNNVAVSG
jgi:hypothetical protein